MHAGFQTGSGRRHRRDHDRRQRLGSSRAVKALDPSVTTVIGGPHATFCATKILQSCDQVDVVVCGEGENTLVALAKALETDAPWEKIARNRLS
jgi:radical SAM superfamily enzyme YgiQ (UPF0313 family)